MNAFGNIYAKRRVLVTGHTGFKGSWLSLWLDRLGADVAGLALAPNTTPSHFELIGLNELVRHFEGDIRNPDDVEKAFNVCNPEIVFHLAAQPLVRDSYADPKTTFDTNIGGTVNILEAVRASSSVKAVVVITSDKCYENREWVWGYRESDPMGGRDPYSASKGAAEIVCASYHRSFFCESGLGPHIGFATVRAGNVIGGGDWAKDRLIPDCVRSLSKNEPIKIRNPNATRPWQHVLDPLSGYLQITQRLLENPRHYSGAWNFGPADTDHITVGTLARQFIEAWGTGEIETGETKKSAKHEAHLLRLSIDKAAYELGWFPVLNSKSALDRTVAWYKAWHEGDGEMRQKSMADIDAYTRLAQERNAAWT